MEGDIAAAAPVEQRAHLAMISHRQSCCTTYAVSSDASLDRAQADAICIPVERGMRPDREGCVIFLTSIETAHLILDTSFCCVTGKEHDGLYQSTSKQDLVTLSDVTQLSILASDTVICSMYRRQSGAWTSTSLAQSTL